MKTRRFALQRFYSDAYSNLKSKLVKKFRPIGSSDCSANEQLGDTLLMVETLEPRQMLSSSIGFDHLADGTQLQAGDLLTQQYSELGVHVFTSDTAHPAMIFDSANVTGGDFDLGSPPSRFRRSGIVKVELRVKPVKILSIKARC